MTVPLRAALYLRVSTARQAEHDVSIPDQKRQGEAYCTSRGYELVETFIEAGASATNDRRPEFQRVIEAGTAKPPAFNVVVVHSFSRFFRDHFELEFYVRKLAKNGVKLVSITQEMGDDPMRVMMRQIMALFDEYQSKENAKHVLRAMNENARQGFWNGALPPIGYRIVAAEQRGSKSKKKLEIDPLHADTVRLAAAIRLLLLTGCRESEILSLRWSFVDAGRSCLRLPDSKTGDKIVPLGEPALNLLAELPRSSDWVFPASTGEGHMTGLPPAWEALREWCGLDGLRLHDLRHSFASVGVAAGESLPIIGALLGHADSATTSRYAHLSADPLKAAADRIAGFIAEAMSGG